MIKDNFAIFLTIVADEEASMKVLFISICLCYPEITT